MQPIPVPKIKTIALHRHHAKSYRKRHIGLLAISLLAFIILFSLIVRYRQQITSSLASGRDFIGGLFNDSSNKSFDLKVHSTFGFDVSFDQKRFYASAIDYNTGDLLLGNQLNQDKAYNVVRIAPNWVNDQSSQSSFTLTYHNDKIITDQFATDLKSFQDTALTDAKKNKSSLASQSTQLLTIDNQKFLKTIWKLDVKNSILPRLSSQVITYVGVVNGQLITIVIDGGLNQSDIDLQFKDVISSLKFGLKKQAYIPRDIKIATNETANRTIIDSLLFSHIASAATNVTSDNMEITAALYGPAVVKIYNAYCMNILIDDKPYVSDACDASFGSGFFINPDGYIATNGHVASADPKSIAIRFAFKSYIDGDTKYLNYLLDIAGVQASDIPATASETELVSTVIDKLYGIPDSRIKMVNNVNNLLVCLTGMQPNTNELIDLTTKRKQYTEQNTIKRADLISSNYLAMDGVSGFRASDVAIIKIKGSDYPTTKLGSLDDIRQGAELMIMGYPGNATDNGIVESSNDTVTLTMGRVSSKKNASGSNSMLIETDTTIGHGNSGGPAFATNGDVIGIATYTVDGSGKGDGVFNYVRDIKDLIRLADKSSVKINPNGVMQDEWKKGIDNFYSSHFSLAVENFNRVKELYPYHSRVDEFIASANQRIEKGEDVKDFPTLAVVIIGLILFSGVSASTFMIIRHKNRHEIYKTKLKSGEISPFTDDIKTQHVNL